MAAIVAAAATDDVRPGLATTEDAGSRGGPDVAGGGRGGRGGAQRLLGAADLHGGEIGFLRLTVFNLFLEST